MSTRSRLRCYSPIVAAGICLVVAQSTSPIVTYVLTISAFVLFFEGGLSLYERVNGGSLKDFRQ